MATATRATTTARSRETLRQARSYRDLTTFLIGAGICLIAVAMSMRGGAVVGLGPLAALLVFFLLVAAWVYVPHFVVAFTIAYFAFLPASKLFFTPLLGPTKDVVTLAAAGAVLVNLYIRRRQENVAPLDTPLTVLIAAFLGLYVVNLGGAISGGQHGLGWAQGVRLVAEPLILLSAGLTVRRPVRVLNLASASFVFTGCVVAFYGVLQQLMGGARLVGLGYSWNLQVRTIAGHLRSFGTLDDPFVYASFLLLALATVLFWMRPGLLAAACSGLILVGLATSYVRTAAVIVVALVALWLVRAKKTVVGFALLAASAAAALLFLFASAGADTTRSVRAGPQAYVTLNGRTTVWATIFDKPSKLPFGVGVGKVGTAADRARQGVIVSSTKVADQSVAVDSGYFAAVADVGLVGFAVLLALLGRLVALGVRGAHQPGSAGWVILAFLTVMLIDASTRASFTGFPTAYLGMLVIGVAVAVVAADAAEPRATRQ